MAKVTIDRQASGFKTVELQNKNAQTIEDGFDNSLSRDGAAPNQMEAELDMNSKAIVNLPDALSNSSPVTLGQASVIKSISQTMSTDLIRPYVGKLNVTANTGLSVTNSDAENRVVADSTLAFSADALPAAAGANITTATEVVVSDNLSQTVLTPISSILGLIPAATTVIRSECRGFITRWKNSNHIYMGTGTCSDDTGTVNIVHTNNVFEKTISSVWAIGSDASQSKGCRATSLSNDADLANKTYFVFVIAKADGTTDFVVDENEAGSLVLEAGNGPQLAAFIHKRCIGIITTNAAGNINNYTQTGNDFIYSDLPEQHAVEADSLPPAVTQNVLLVGMPKTTSALTNIQQHVYGFGASRAIEQAWLHVRPNGETQTTERTHQVYFYGKGGDYGTSQTGQFQTRRLASATGQVAVFRWHSWGGNVNNADNVHAKTWMVVDSFTFDRSET